MKTTKKTQSISLHKESLQQLNELSKYYEENNSQVVRRAIAALHWHAIAISHMESSTPIKTKIREGI